MQYPSYQFKSLLSFTREEIRILNQATSSFSGSDNIFSILNAVSDAFYELDISDFSEKRIVLQVRALSEGSTVQTYTFNQQAVILGRIQESHLMLKSPLVSKKHAEVTRTREGYFIKDLNSNNGTFLNEIQLEPNVEKPLKTDDSIRIEPFVIGVEIRENSEKQPLSISLVSMMVGRAPQLKGRIGVWFDILPAGKTGLLLLDQETAHYLMHKLITGHKTQHMTAWTDIDSGLMEYLTCRIFVAVNSVLTGFRLLLQKVEAEPEANQQWFSKNEESVELTFSANTEIGRVCPVLFLPAQLVEKPVEINVKTFLERVPWIRHLSYVFAVRLGMTYLTREQISMLGEGDILLLEQTGATLENNLPQGSVELRCNQLKRGSIRGSLICGSNGECRITVERLDEEGLRHMADASKKMEESPGSGSQTIVAGLEIPVTVELARVNFTIDELGSIREGQIIELHKPQPEIVDLSVDGKVIGSGRLVDVEGKLGVRIIKALKTK